MYQRYAQPDMRWECGRLGPPVKVYQWLSEFAAWGQWFEGGAIFWRNGWEVALGNYGQTAGRLTESPLVVAPADAEVPPDMPPAPPSPPDPPEAEAEPSWVERRKATDDRIEP